MQTEKQLPNTLLEAVRYFSDLDVCHEFLVSMRWSDGVICPRCGSERVGFVASRRIWNCKGCRKQFSVKVGTVLEDSPLGLDKWLVVIWLLTGAKNGISSCEVARALGVTQKTAWFLLMRVREILDGGTIEKMSGTVEVDETFVGGKEGNKHFSKKLKAGRGSVGKAIVMGMLQRSEHAGKISQVRCKVIPNTQQDTLHTHIGEMIAQGSQIYTDAHRGYNGLSDSFKHAFVDHAVAYVEGAVHTNGCENFWSLLDRSIHGTYIRPEAQHLARYANEQSFRFNHRDGTDLTRFIMATQRVAGKRLTYKTLTGN